MKVARIEIFGFKSFMERLVLPLEGGITGVVGPNGCGKSNIVDALRWVLGETKASNLRGGVLEDVIFNGTERQRPMGLAEVTITLRASDDTFFSDLVSQDTEAELLIQSAIEEGNAESPAEEAPEAEAESDGGPPKLRVLQGRKDTPEEEDASVSATDAMLKTLAMPSGHEAALEAKNPSLVTRFSWLKSVQEVQVTRRLYRSGESEFFINRVPCRLKDLKDLFRAVGLGARAYTIVAQGEVSRIVTAKPEERRLILEEAAGVLGFRDKIASAERRLEETKVNISRLDDIAKEVGRQVNSLRRQASIAKNRQMLRQQLRDIETEVFNSRLLQISLRSKECEGIARDAQAAEARAENSVQACQLDEQAARGDLIGADVEGDEIRAKIDGIREELSNRGRQRAEHTSRINELRAFSLARTTEIKRLEERRMTLTQRANEGEQELRGLESEEQNLSQQLLSVEKSNDDELKNAASQLATLRAELKEKEQTVRGIREKLISTQSRADAVSQQVISASPVSQLRRTIGENHDLFAGLEHATLFIDGLKVPERYATAAQAVLAERAEFMVSPQPYEIARRFSDAAAKDDPKSKKGLGLGVFRHGGEDAAASSYTGETPAGGEQLSSVVTIDPSIALAARRVLENVWVVPSLAEATAFFEREGAINSPLTLVTLAGEIITAHSFYSFRHQGGIIQLKNLLEELVASCAVLTEQQTLGQEQQDQLLAAVASAEKRHVEALRESQARQAKMRELSNQLGNVRGRIDSSRRMREQITGDTTKVDQQIEDARQKIDEFRLEEDRIQQEIAKLAGTVDEELRQQLETLNVSYAKVDAVRKEGREKLSKFAHALHAARKELDDARATLSGATLESQKLTLETQSFRERIVNEYGEEFYAALTPGSSSEALLPEGRLHDLMSEATRLRERMIREGDVDPTSIERFEEESRRLEDIENQKKDLSTAAETLLRTIERLAKTSEERFLQTFVQVRENFSKLVPRLFGGGKGSLELLDPDHPLESGVEIIARPPGKKLKSIELLSGGEKALCATAMIFSMFLVRPGPLCVLDEVDAPLDESNLVRFLSLVKEMSSKIQFLMITHNKQSMAVSNHLVGVTMPEPGASKTISVSLQEAYSQVA